MKRLCRISYPVLLLAALAGCSADRKSSELTRQVSPNQKLIAVLIETLTAGAAGAVHEDLYLGDQGIPLNAVNPVFSTVNCEGLKVSWANDYTVEIHYPRSCAISHFTNRWYRPADLQVGRPNPTEIILLRD